MDRQVNEWNNTAVEQPKTPVRWRLPALTAATLIAFMVAAIGFFSPPPAPPMPKLAPGEGTAMFMSEIRVQKNGSLLVTENSRTSFNGATPRHGILRRIPSVYLDEEKKEQTLSFSDHHATIELVTEPRSQPFETGVNNFGEEEKFATYRIGNSEIILDPGTYDFVFQFAVNGLVRPINGGAASGFIWNVTGGHLSPLQTSQLRVQLPAFVDPQTVTYATFLGLIEDSESVESAKNPKAHAPDVGVTFDKSPDEKEVFVTFKANRPLRSFEHFVVKVGWPPGFLDGGL